MHSKTEGNFKSKPTRLDLLLSATFLKFFPPTVKPNHITVFRFISIPFVLYFLLIESYVVTIVLLAISAFSDALDGAMARVRHQITDWGKLYDPLADKLLIVPVASILISELISIYLAASIIVVELLLISNAYYKKRYRQKVIQAQLTGKIKMFLQSVGLLVLLIYVLTLSPVLLFVATYTLYASLLFALISLFVYRSI